MTRPLLTFMLLMLAMVTTRAEAPDMRPDDKVWPESPQARAFSEVMMPVPSLMTGACEFTVPLYTIDVEGFRIPLALSYHSNGIKMSDDPRPLGYGWSLTPPLRISRTIMGRPDGIVTNVAARGKEFAASDVKKAHGCIAKRLGTIVSDDFYDSEYDIFTIYLIDATLTVIYKNGAFVGVNTSEYRITADSKLKVIKVTDTQGNIYEFSVSANYCSGSTGQYEWMLSSVTLQSGTRITLGWHDMAPFSHARIAPPRSIIYNNEGGFLYDTYRFSDEYTETSSGSSENIKSLSWISFPGGKLTCSYTGERLAKVNVSNYSTDIFTASLSNDGKRLNSVTIGGVGKYTFGYNSAPAVEDETACDWWGYPNGKDNRRDGRRMLSPHLKIKGLPDTLRDFGVDRSVNAQQSMSYMLREVTYPTGGSTTWDYELHRFNAPLPPVHTDLKIDNEITPTQGGGVRVKSISHSSGSGISRRTYYYGENRSGLARVEAVPFLSTFIDYNNLLIRRTTTEHNSQAALWQDSRVIVNHQSNYLEQHPGLTPIWYDHVEEVSDEGKTEYTFTKLSPGNLVYEPYGRVTVDGAYHLYTPFSKGPVMTKKSVYEVNSFGTYKKLEEEEYDYRTVRALTDSVVPFFRVYRNHIVIDGDDAPDWNLRTEGFSTHYFVRGRHSVTSPEGTVFSIADTPAAASSSGSVLTPETPAEQSAFWYSPQTYHLHLQTEQLQRKITRRFYGSHTMTTTERYSYKPGTSLMQSTVVSNGTDSVRTEYCYVDSLSATMRGVMASRNITGIPVSVREFHKGAMAGYALEMCQSGNSLRPRRVWRLRNAERWSADTYEYNSKGQLITRTTPTGLKTVWTRDSLGNPLKMNVGDGALVSNATWTALIGVTSLTTPAGIKETFTYDSFGRLASRSLNSRLLEEYIYSTAPGDYHLQTRNHYSADGYLSNYARYDGLGRNYMSQQEQPDGTFLTVLTDYDPMSRPEKQWLPVPATPGITPYNFRVAAREYYNDDNPYQTMVYEHSPRGILTKSIRPGEAWHNGEINSFPQETLGGGIAHSQRIALATNTAGSSAGVDRYEITSTGVRLNGKHPDGTLMMQTTTDEDDHIEVVTTDFRGNTLLLQNPGGTNYIYNDFGELAYILPPGLTGTHSRTDQIMQQLAYWYDYDSRGRLVTKKLPGVRETYYIYDSADRLVAEQNADLASGQWRLYGYDRLGRSVLTLDCRITRAQAEQYASALRTAVLDGGPLQGYTLAGVPVSKPTVVTASYYDNYNFITLLSLPDAFNSTAPKTYSSIAHSFPAFFTTCAGLLTGVYTGSGYEAYYYDNAGRVMQRYATGFNTGRTTNYYTYAGQTAVTVHESDSDESAGSTVVEYTYDTAGRPTQTKVTKSFPKSPILIPISTAEQPDQSGTLIPIQPQPGPRDYYTSTLTTTYNSLGQPVTTRHGNGITRNYTYNLHGWLKNTQTTLMLKTLNETLHYETGKYPCYNGNISAKEWTNGRYDYQYDNYNRLTNAWFDTENYPGDYTVSYTYDSRGNPEFVKRKGVIDKSSSSKITTGVLDQMSMSYAGNRLISIDCMSEALPYEGMTGIGKNDIFNLGYDSAGRLTSDFTRDILTVIYDNNGNAIWTEFVNGSSVTDYYDGMGNHLATDICEIDYALSKSHDREYTGSGLIIENGEPQIERVPGGYFDYATKTFRYYITDYQGNNIAVAGELGQILEQTDYYPYGEPWQEPDHPFTYSDNERLHTFGQNQYDFHARRLISSLLRFDKPDPLMEKYPWLSPYTFCGGNPIMYTDHDGLKFTKDAEKVVKEFKNEVKKMAQNSEIEIQMRRNLKSVLVGSMAEYNQQSLNAVQETFDEMNEVLSEIEVLNKSDQEYDIKLTQPDPNSDISIGSTDMTDDGKILMEIPRGNITLTAHELKHAYQFEEGEISFGKAKHGFYDLTDEEAAYKRATHFGGSMNDFNPDNYSRYPTDNRSLSKHFFGNKNVAPSILQGMADQHQIKMRWGGKTYIGKKKSK